MYADLTSLLPRYIHQMSPSDMCSQRRDNIHDKLERSDCSNKTSVLVIYVKQTLEITLEKFLSTSYQYAWKYMYTYSIEIINVETIIL